MSEAYLYERKAGLHSRNNYDIFYLRRDISNYQLRKMWSRVLNITCLRDLALLCVSLNRILPGYQKHMLSLEGNTATHGFYASTPQYLHFTSREESLGNANLQKIGLRENSPFVCFHGRDSTYLDTVYPSLRDWYYHSHRDCSIANFIQAAKELASRGYFVFRMGAIVKEPLVTTHPMIIDYATKYRTDFLDIFLSAKCNFFLSSVSGIDEVARIFRRKIICANCIPLEFIFIWNHISLFIPKKLLLKKEKRFLTFREIIDLGIGRFDCRECYDEQGIEIVENTPVEISDLVIEKDERIKGAWRNTQEDEELQLHFWDILRKSKLYRSVSARIGTQFLRQNLDLLE